MGKLWITFVVVIAFGVSISGENVIVDSICDCDDQEAMYYKPARQLLNDGPDGDSEFLKHFHLRPTCASNGFKYGSICEFQCVASKQPELNLKIVPLKQCRHKGPGKRNGKWKKMDQSKHPHVCICPRHYFPICGSDGITYGNKCAFECAKATISPEITIVHQGTKCKVDDETFL